MATRNVTRSDHSRPNVSVFVLFDPIPFTGGRRVRRVEFFKKLYDKGGRRERKLVLKEENGPLALGHETTGLKGGE
eukprot:2080719-Heterocapsa_arctica.AAC.1